MAQAATTATDDGIPSVMTAVQQSGYGEARDVLTLANDVPVPRKLSPNQVLVRVHAASINPVDWKLLQGKMSLIMRHPFPHTPGQDVAGVVVDVGSSIQRLRVGDKVYGNFGGNGGSYAEYVRGNESAFALKPANLTMVEAAAVPLACETSYQSLFGQTSPPVGPGSKVFVCGGSTATGLYAIQMAKAVGADVATTCSQRNFSFLEKLGYKIVHESGESKDDPRRLLVIDYNTKDFGKELKDQNYDVVYDCVGGQQQWLAAQQILKRAGQFITITGDDPEASISVKAVATIGSNIVARKFWSVFGAAQHSYILYFLRQSYQGLDNIRTKYVETGKVKPIIDTVFDWRKDGAEALYAMYEKSKSGKAQGKLVLQIADEP